MEKMNLIVGVLVGCALLFAGYYYTRHSASRKQGVGAVHDERTTVKRIGVLVPVDDPIVNDIVTGIVETLEKEATFKPEVTVFQAGGSRTLLRSSLEEAITKDYDLIVALGSQTAQMAREVTQKRKKLIPIIFAATGDPIKLGLVDAYESSGNHLTGACIVGTDWVHTMVDLFPVVLPGVKKVLIPYDPTGLGGIIEVYKQELDAALKRNGITATPVQVYETNEVIRKITPFIDECDMVLALPCRTLTTSLAGVAKLCEQRRKGLASVQNLSNLDAGAFFAFGYHKYDAGVIVAQQIRMILEQGVLPTKIPVNPMNSAYRIGIDRHNMRKQCMDAHSDQRVLYLMEKAEVR